MILVWQHRSVPLSTIPATSPVLILCIQPLWSFNFYFFILFYFLLLLLHNNGWFSSLPQGYISCALDHPYLTLLPPQSLVHSLIPNIAIFFEYSLISVFGIFQLHLPVHLHVSLKTGICLLAFICHYICSIYIVHCMLNKLSE